MNISPAINISHLTKAVDELGALKAVIATYKTEEKDLKDLLKESGLTELDGIHYRMTIANTTRCTLDAAKVRSILSDADTALCTRKTDVSTLKISSRRS